VQQKKKVLRESHPVRFNYCVGWTHALCYDSSSFMGAMKHYIAALRSPISTLFHYFYSACFVFHFNEKWRGMKKKKKSIIFKLCRGEWPSGVWKINSENFIRGDCMIKLYWHFYSHFLLTSLYAILAQYKQPTTTKYVCFA
jgi:hypothetical protein